jgi:hypothetical protein
MEHSYLVISFDDWLLLKLHTGLPAATKRGGLRGILHWGQKLYQPLVPHFQMDWDHVHHNRYTAKCSPHYRTRRGPD